MPSAECPVCNQNTDKDPQTGRCTKCGRLPNQTAYDDSVQRSVRARGTTPSPSAAYRTVRTVAEPAATMTFTTDRPARIDFELPIDPPPYVPLRSHNPTVADLPPVPPKGDSDGWDDGDDEDDDDERPPWFKFGTPTFTIHCECGASFTYLETSAPPEHCAFCQKLVA